MALYQDFQCGTNQKIILYYLMLHFEATASICDQFNKALSAASAVQTFSKKFEIRSGRQKNKLFHLKNLLMKHFAGIEDRLN